MVSAWARRNCRQVVRLRRGAGAIRSCLSTRRTVDAPTRAPRPGSPSGGRTSESIRTVTSPQCCQPHDHHRRQTCRSATYAPFWHPTRDSAPGRSPASPGAANEPSGSSSPLRESGSPHRAPTGTSTPSGCASGIRPGSEPSRKDIAAETRVPVSALAAAARSAGHSHQAGHQRPSPPPGQPRRSRRVPASGLGRVRPPLR